MLFAGLTDGGRSFGSGGESVEFGLLEGEKNVAGAFFGVKIGGCEKGYSNSCSDRTCVNFGWWKGHKNLKVQLIGEMISFPE